MVAISVNIKFVSAIIGMVALLASLYLTYEAKVITDSAGKTVCFIILLFLTVVIFSLSKEMDNMRSH